MDRTSCLLKKYILGLLWMLAYPELRYYYDNKKLGEVDYLIDDRDNLSVIPIEIKSGKDYQIHSALDKFLQIKEYNIHQAFVLSNAQQVEIKNGITYLPIYYIMCIEPNEEDDKLLL